MTHLPANEILIFPFRTCNTSAQCSRFARLPGLLKYAKHTRKSISVFISLYLRYIYVDEQMLLHIRSRTFWLVSH
jgi:hypothetical protein